MADRDVAGAALARVWQVYRLINLGVEENDPRRAMLDRFLRKQRDAGLTDVEMLAVERPQIPQAIGRAGSGFS